MEVADATLMAQITAGDKEAFARFYDRHAARTFGLLVKFLGRGKEAEDVLQETFWQVWNTADRYDPARGNPTAWLVLLARSRALDQLRRNSRRPVGSSDLTEIVDVPNGCPKDSMELAELAQQARGAINQLPPEQRLAIQRAFFGGFTHVQIAEQEGLPLGTVKTRIRMGMCKLRDILREKGGITG